MSSFFISEGARPPAFIQDESHPGLLQPLRLGDGTLPLLTLVLLPALTRPLSYSSQM